MCHKMLSYLIDIERETLFIEASIIVFLLIYLQIAIDFNGN